MDYKRVLIAVLFIANFIVSWIMIDRIWKWLKPKIEAAKKIYNALVAALTILDRILGVIQRKDKKCEREDNIEMPDGIMWGSDLPESWRVVTGVSR